MKLQRRALPRGMNDVPTNPLCHTAGHIIVVFLLSSYFEIGDPDTYICDPLPSLKPSVAPVSEPSFLDFLHTAMLMNYAPRNSTPEIRNEETPATHPFDDWRPRRPRVNCSSLRLPYQSSNVASGEHRYHRFYDYDLKLWLDASLWTAIRSDPMIGITVNFVRTEVLTVVNLFLFLLTSAFAYVVLQVLIYDEAGDENRIDPRLLMKFKKPVIDNQKVPKDDTKRRYRPRRRM